MHDRLLAAVGSRTYRQVGDLTNTHPETVRRYLQGQSPSVEFVAALSKALSLNADWILTGQGPMKRDQLKAHALATADTSELLTAMSETLERLIGRVERVEVYMQTLETRVRAAPDDTPAQLEDPSPHITRVISSRRPARPRGHEHTVAGEPGEQGDDPNGGER